MFKKLFLALMVCFTVCIMAHAQAADNSIYFTNVSSMSKSVLAATSWGQAGGYVVNNTTWTVVVNFLNGTTIKWSKLIAANSSATVDLSGKFATLNVMVSTSPVNNSGDPAFVTGIAQNICGFIKYAQ